jgi:hypothetical protein
VPDPGFTRPDLCSISAVTEQTDSADAVGSLLSADRYPPAGDYSLGPVTPYLHPPVTTSIQFGFLRSWLRRSEG